MLHMHAWITHMNLYETIKQTEVQPGYWGMWTLFTGALKWQYQALLFIITMGVKI